MPVCILGMHRSGTSMVTRLLNQSGLYLGLDDNLMPPHPKDNPAGYWENLRFTHLNDEILEALGGSWHHPPAAPPGWWKQSSIDGFRQRANTGQLIKQLQLTLPKSFEGEILVMDDGSTDETPEMLAALSQEWPLLKTLRNPDNLGFIGSCNRGAERATSEFLLFLNNDTMPKPGWFVPLLETFEKYPDAGAVRGKLIYPDGTLQEAGGIIFSDGSGWNFGRNDPAIDHPLYNHVREVDYCSGVLLTTRREVFLNLGGFDILYQPAYYEDADYCFQLRQHNLKVYYQPKSVVVHFEGISSGTDITSGVKRHQAINKRKFMDKWQDVLKRQPPPPPAVNQQFRYQLVVREEREEGEAYAY